MWSVKVPVPIFSKVAYQYFVVNCIPDLLEGAEGGPVPETTGGTSADSLFAFGEMRQPGDSEDASASVQVCAPAPPNSFPSSLPLPLSPFFIHAYTIRLLSQELRPERLLPPSRAPEAEVREIVRTVAVHRRPLCVRDKFGVEIMSLDAAFSELRPPRTSAGL